jgi:ABC-type transport system involved in cytochrome c biogenesis ATPase subunit
VVQQLIGAGKWTLLKIAAGLITPDSGTVRIDDTACPDVALAFSQAPITSPGARAGRRTSSGHLAWP